MFPLTLLLTACPPANEQTPAVPPQQAQPPAAGAPTPSSDDRVPAGTKDWSRRLSEAAVSEDWAAVFWRNDRAWLVGGPLATDLAVVGKRSAGTASPAVDQQPARCAGTPIAAPDGVILALPPGTEAPAEIQKAPATPAKYIEAASWRLHELLPPPDDYTPRVRTGRMTEQGVEMGSVAKTRRRSSPPVLLASGTRSCTAVIAALDKEGAKVLSYVVVPDVCDPPGLIYPTDLDGDGHRETAAGNGVNVIGVRIRDDPGSLALELLGSWSCPAESE